MTKASKKITVPWGEKPVEVVFCVITDAPETDGNLYDGILTTDGNLLYADVLGDGTNEYRVIETVKMMAFQTGEILAVTRDYGREVNGPQRKPKKWFVGFETYERFEDALQRAFMVTQCWQDKRPLPPPKVKPIETQTAESRKAEVDVLIKKLEEMPKEDFERLPLVQMIRKFVAEDNE